jgi:exonuclease SbcD
VPYLRERDVRKSDIGETAADKEPLLVEGIKNHYSEVCALAESKRDELLRQDGATIPIIATGHLFTAGGKSSDGDGVRELYIGSLGHINSTIFPTPIDYVALGHLHVPQIVSGNEMIRYAGAPLPMSFGEAKQEKIVVIVEFDDEKTPVVKKLSVPVFQKLERIKGDLTEITERLLELKSENSRSWLEIEYTGKDIAPDLKERLDEIVEGSELLLLRVINQRIIDRVLAQNYENETLDDLSETDVFTRCMDANEVPVEQRKMLMQLYDEVLFKLNESKEE